LYLRAKKKQFEFLETRPKPTGIGINSLKYSKLVVNLVKVPLNMKQVILKADLFSVKFVIQDQLT